jgi:hypothetical protein
MSHPTPDAARPPYVPIMRRLGLEPDPWQVEVLEAGHPRLLLNGSRHPGRLIAAGRAGTIQSSDPQRGGQHGLHGDTAGRD